MLLVERPALYPGAGLRGLSSPRGMVDTLCDMPVGGRVYLEEQTVHEAAIKFGYLAPAEAAKLRAEIAAGLAEVAVLERKLAAYEELGRAVEQAKAVA